jgi:hypothetical protein
MTNIGPSQLLTVALLFVYIIAYGVVFLVVVRWKAKRSGTRLPRPFKLLRSPGESLRRKVQQMEEFGPLLVIGCAMAPMIFMLGVATVLVRAAPHLTLTTGLTIVAVLGGIAFAVGILFLYRVILRYRAYRLGYCGERAVGEHLQLLGGEYRVFHDVPAEGEKKKFNLDHVTVGPTGICAIETKTRRKGKALPGKEDYVVTYDGERLVWPWGEDSRGIRQVASEADWLRKWIFQRTGINTSVRPILAIPGWYTKANEDHTIKVVNEKRIAAFVKSGPTVLSTDQTNRIVTELDKTCRDVED